MDARKTRRNTAHAIEDALLCACEDGERAVAARLYTIGAHLEDAASSVAFPRCADINSYQTVRVSEMHWGVKWGVKWGVNGLYRGLVFSNFETEQQAQHALVALQRMDFLDSATAGYRQLPM
jgi:hypothetical protein